MTQPEPLTDYQSSLMRWVSIKNSPARNRVFRENHAAFKLIRETSEGQALIRRLADSDNERIAALAATHALWFDDEFAKPILARISSSPSEAGLSATWTLRQQALGKLDLDW